MGTSGLTQVISRSRSAERFRLARWRRTTRTCTRRAAPRCRLQFPDPAKQGSPRRRLWKKSCLATPRSGGPLRDHTTRRIFRHTGLRHAAARPAHLKDRGRIRLQACRRSLGHQHPLQGLGESVPMVLRVATPRPAREDNRAPCLCDALDQQNRTEIPPARQAALIYHLLVMATLWRILCRGG